MGAVNVTLIDQPEIDFSVRALGSCDLMAIPGIRQVALFFVNKVHALPGSYPCASLLQLARRAA